MSQYNDTSWSATLYQCSSVQQLKVSRMPSGDLKKKIIFRQLILTLKINFWCFASVYHQTSSTKVLTLIKTWCSPSPRPCLWDYSASATLQMFTSASQGFQQLIHERSEHGELVWIAVISEGERQYLWWQGRGQGRVSCQNIDRWLSAWLRRPDHNPGL